jgi:Family of unknown function (DUF6353)
MREIVNAFSLFVSNRSNVMQAKWLNNVGQFTKQNSPTILSAVAVGGVVATAILAVRATPKAVRRIEQLEDHGELRVSRTEKVKETWTLYIPAGLSGLATVGCIIGANAIGTRRNAALLAAYTLVDSTFREYKDKVVEKLGEAREQHEIGDSIMQDRIDKNSPSSEVIIMAGGDQLCYDSLTGRYFKSDIETLRRAENEINRRIIAGDMYASQNEFYEQVKLPNVDIGDELGWNIDNPIKLIFSSHLNECSGEPALAVRYEKLPVRDFGKAF